MLTNTCSTEEKYENTCSNEEKYDMKIRPRQQYSEYVVLQQRYVCQHYPIRKHTAWMLFINSSRTDQLTRLIYKFIVRVRGITARVLLMQEVIDLQIVTPGIRSVCLGSRQVGYRSSPGLLPTNTWSSMHPGRTNFHHKTRHITTLLPRGLWFDIPDVANVRNFESFKYTIH